VAACDVGQGDALAVHTADGQAIVLDTGPPGAGLSRCLRGLGVRHVPLAVLSHFHADHSGGLEELLAGWRVGTLLVQDTAAAGAAAALALAEAAGTAVHVARPGERLTVGGAVVEVVSPAPKAGAATADGEESSAENDRSLAVRVEADGLSLLATGDLEPAGQRAVLRQGADVKADILKVPHHGSARQDERFLAATEAKIALVSVGAGNTYGHPAASTLNRLDRLGMTVARTDQHGAVAVIRRDGALAVVSQR
jgi:competence protein ComEC